MIHCAGCNGLVYGGYDDGEHDPCPGCGHEAIIAALTAERDELKKLLLGETEAANRIMAQLVRVGDERDSCRVERDALRQRVAELEPIASLATHAGLVKAQEVHNKMIAERDARIAELEHDLAMWQAAAGAK